MNASQPKLIIFANCFIQPLVSGGDKRFIELARRWKEQIHLSIITPAVGLSVCRDIEQLHTNYHTLAIPWTDRLGIAITYICRTILALSRIPKFKHHYLAYSSSDILPDVVPAFLMKIINKDSSWISSIFHLIPPPSRRPGSWTRNTLSYLAQRLSLFFIKRWADLVLITNKNMQAELINRFHFPQSKIRMTRMGIEKALIDSIDPPEKCYEGIFLGRLVPSKGIFDLIEIWKLVVKEYPSARLAIIGAGEETMIAKLKERIGKNKLDNNIDLLGFLDKKEVIRQLKSARIFLFPSWEEGWGISIAEAMACGLPVITYNLPIYEEIFKTGITGVPLGDMAGFAEKVIHFLRDRETLIKMSREAFLQSGKHDWDIVAKQEFEMITNFVDYKCSPIN
jgi:glycosyltransferase involved in cell wall biosynthesis